MKKEAFLIETISQNIKTLAVQVDKKLTAHLKAQGITLTGTQLAVLGMVYDRHGAQLLQKEVETRLHLSHPTTRGIIKRLVNLQLLVTSAPATDKRQVALQLTESGRQLFAHYQPGLTTSAALLEERLLAGLTDEEIATLRKVLPQMVANLA